MSSVSSSLVLDHKLVPVVAVSVVLHLVHVDPLAVVAGVDPALGDSLHSGARQGDGGEAINNLILEISLIIIETKDLTLH